MLVSTNYVLTAQGLSLTNQRLRARYDVLRQGVEQAIRNYCKWELEYGSVTDFYDGNGYVSLPLRRPFVQVVSSVYCDSSGYYGNGTDPFPATSLLVNGEDYSLKLDDADQGKSGLLIKLGFNSAWLFPSDLVYSRRAGGLAYQKGAYWPAGQGNLKVTYSYGFVTYVPVTGATWSGGVATYTTSGPHNLVTGRNVTIEGVGPNGWNGSFVVRSTPTTLTFAVGIGADPGTFATAGTVDAVPQDLKLAVTTGVGIVANSSRYGFPTTSEGLGAYNYSLSIMREPEMFTVRQLLSRFRDTTI